MKNIFKIFIVLVLLAVISGCAGGRAGGSKIQGIAEREISRPRLPLRIAINPHAFNFFINATIFESMGENYMAKDQYGRALELVPTSNMVRYSYSLMLNKLKEYRNSINEAEQISPKDLDSWLLIGNNYRTLTLYDSSLTAYYNALEIDSNISSIYYFMGAYYQQNSKMDSAIWAFQHVARLVPDYASFQQLANLQLRSGKIEDAKTSYYQSLEYDSTVKNVRSDLALSALYEESGDRKKAEERTETAEHLKRDDLVLQQRL
ncbi:MAG: hypothetical protein GY865_09260, partial [candidate division Zixibacteria bacterium]|nr:hypothetical protein [candidate division Zixibacteria bacterium]